jgi:hypothetical protein
VLLERERQIGTRIEIAVERREGAEAKSAQRVVEVRGTHRNFRSTTRDARFLLLPF